jgi:hypothetical protein
MAKDEKRGSEKLMAAWKARALTEESVREVADVLGKSPAKVEGVSVSGGANATGIQLNLRYDGDDVPLCGNDILFWLTWLRKHGGVVRPPKIIINGTPWPDLVRVQLDFGHVMENTSKIPDLSEDVRTGGFGG